MESDNFPQLKTCCITCFFFVKKYGLMKFKISTIKFIIIL